MKILVVAFVNIAAAFQTAPNGSKFAGKSVEELQRMMGGIPQSQKEELTNFYKHGGHTRRFSIE